MLRPPSREAGQSASEASQISNKPTVSISRAGKSFNYLREKMLRTIVSKMLTKIEVARGK